MSGTIPKHTQAKGIISAPHYLASEAGAEILKLGGNAVEAMVAAAAAIAVVYPHMNSIGGDGFWLISEPGKPVCAIEACGPAAQAASIDFYKENKCSTVPARGGLAALTVAGTVSGWQKALQLYGGNMPLSDVLAPAIDYAKRGIKITKGQAELTLQKWDELKTFTSFTDTFAPSGKDSIRENKVLTLPALANSLAHLADVGLDDFYRGDLARTFAKGLAAQDSPISLQDLEAYQAKVLTPLLGQFNYGDIYNMPPPTQGIASLMILGIFEKLGKYAPESFAYHHNLIEAVKQVFIMRNAHVQDPNYMDVNVQDWLNNTLLSELGEKINSQQALAWPHISKQGDTVWMGAADNNGLVVSFIQSTYWEFGSGIVPNNTGIVWQNRGHSFSLEPNTVNALAPGKKPFHTLNPALAKLKDGRTLAYGTMGGEGQPQTQAQIFTRYVDMKYSLQAAIEAPRWLLGRTWGEETTTLKLEKRFSAELISDLKKAGHDIEMVDDFSSMMGHAGGVCLLNNGVFEGGFDPRSDGAVMYV